MKPTDLIELEYLSTLEIIGEGAFELLQGQITCDMERIKDGRVGLGALCNLKGRVTSSFVIIKKPQSKNSFLLIGHSMIMEETKKTLAKYSPFYELEMHMNTTYSFFALDKVALNNLFLETNLDLNLQEHEEILRIHYLNKRYCLLAIQEKNKQILKKFNICKDLKEWEIDNIQNKVIDINFEEIGEYTPHELGYHQTERIDFNKGCYTGQEIVARIHYRAKKQPFVQYGTLEKKEITKEVFDNKKKKIGSVLRSMKKEDKTYCLISMNKNYSEGEIMFENASSLKC